MSQISASQSRKSMRSVRRTEILIKEDIRQVIEALESKCKIDIKTCAGAELKSLSQVIKKDFTEFEKLNLELIQKHAADGSQAEITEAHDERKYYKEYSKSILVLINEIILKIEDLQ